MVILDEKKYSSNTEAVETVELLERYERGCEKHWDTYGTVVW